MKIALIVFYLVVAIAMVAFIMVQRGSGATTGSGFGAGASGTVFGARGSANFLSSGTKWLAILFFSLSMGMAVYQNRMGNARAVQEELGVMGQLPTASETPAAPSETPAAPGETPPAPAGETPPAPAGETPAAPSETPAAPAVETPDAQPPAAEAVPTEASPATTSETSNASGDKSEEKTP